MINIEPDAPKTVGQRIEQARIKAGLTQSELAAKLNYSSPTAVSLIEAGKRSVKVETLEKIAEFLHQDVAFLATGKKPTTSVRTALRADSSFDADDVKEIENFIDYLIAKKEKDGRRPDSKRPQA